MNKRPDVTRRHFLRLVGASAVLAAVSKNALAAVEVFFPGIELDVKYAPEQAQIHAYQKRLHDPAVQALLEDPRKASVATKEMIVGHPACSFEMLPERTKIQVRDFYNRRVVLLSRKAGEPVVTLQSLGRLTGGVSRKSLEFELSVKRDEWAGRGHATLIRRGTELFFVTNAHVIKDVDPVHGAHAAELEKRAPTDIAFYRVTRDDLIGFGISPSDAIDIDEPLPPGFGYNALPVMCRAFDPDTMSGIASNPDGFKEWLGIARKMPRGVWEKVKNTIKSATGGMYTHLSEHGYTFRIPDGQASEIGNDPKQRIMPATGVSGDVVTALVNRKIRMVGIQFCAYPIIVDGKEYSESGFHALPEIAKALDDKSRIFNLKAQSLGKTLQGVQSRI